MLMLIHDYLYLRKYFKYTLTNLKKIPLQEKPITEPVDQKSTNSSTKWFNSFSLQYGHRACVSLPNYGCKPSLHRRRTKDVQEANTMPGHFLYAAYLRTRVQHNMQVRPLPPEC